MLTILLAQIKSCSCRVLRSSFVEQVHLPLLGHMLPMESFFSPSRLVVGLLLGRWIKPKPVLADTNAIPQNDIVADSAVTERGVARDFCVASDEDIWANHTVAFYGDPLLNLNASKNYCVSPDISRLMNARTAVYYGTAMV